MIDKKDRMYGYNMLVLMCSIKYRVYYDRLTTLEVIYIIYVFGTGNRGSVTYRGFITKGLEHGILQLKSQRYTD